VSPRDKPLIILAGELKTPPMPGAARKEAGHLLRQVQQGVAFSMPESRPMPRIGPRCHELRIQAERNEWRVIYRTDSDAVVVPDIFLKKSRTTPKQVLEACTKRYRDYDRKRKELADG
jgi:phage-related protein